MLLRVSEQLVSLRPNLPPLVIGELVTHFFNQDQQRPPRTLAITNLLWILLGALGGIVIPANRLPAVAQEVVHYLPSGALGEAMREAFLHGSLNGGAALILLLWTFLAGAAAIRWFKWN